jgi:ABC-type nickel/cobalt efflux system permease component RcnA
MIALVNGDALTFKLESPPEIHPNQDHHEFRFRFAASWPADLDRGKPINFSFNDTNFESSEGRMSLVLKVDSGLNVIDLIDPAGLRGLSPLDLKPGQEQKLRKASAMFELPKKASPAIEPSPPTEPVVVGEQPGLAKGLWERGLPALFESDAGVGLLLLAAGIFGMAHAFTPGHGKTLVAAYLIGERGTIRHACMLGFSTTLAHTGSVIAVAVVLWWLYPESVPQEAQGWLQLAGGALIFIVGFWLLMQRLRGRADHVHLFNNHHHDCQSFGWGRVILLGLGGGLIPCWDAVMLLLVAISAGRLGFAIPMLIAFSVGLAAVLVLLGIAIVMAHRAGSGRFGDRQWFKLLPVLSAALLLLMGLWLAREGVQLLSQASKGL